MILRLVVIMAAMALAGPLAQASLWCDEPQQPYCIDEFGAFDDRWEFDRCRDEVEEFVTKTNRDVECLQEDIADKVRAANEAVEKFNCRAEGGSIC